MRIGIDACTWANRRGYGRFTRLLVTTMVAEHPQHQFILVADQHTAAECDFRQEHRSKSFRRASNRLKQRRPIVPAVRRTFGS